MGQVGSTGEFTQEGIKEIKDVKETDVMMNLIFRYMLKHMDMNDFFKLSQPDTCQDYVVSLAQHMSTQFSRLQILPYKENKSDVLLFTKYIDLDPSKKSTTHSEGERKSLCLLLSYYYVRIFQIYGALAITLLNDISSSEGTLKASKDDPRLVNKTPGYSKTRVANIQQFGGVQGGATKEEINFSMFECMVSYFAENEPYSSSRGWKTKFQNGKSNGARVYFDKTGESETKGIKSDKGRFIIYLPATNDRYFTLEVIATRISSKRNDIILKYVTLKSSDAKTFPIPDSLKTDVSIIHEGDPASYKVKSTKTKNTTDTTGISSYFTDVFDTLIEDLLKKKSQTSEESSTDEKYDKDKDPALIVSSIKPGLEGRKTVGHCIARALQLLRTIPSTVRGGPPSYESDICMEKFSFTSRSYTGSITPSKDRLTRGIPKYGGPIAYASKSDAGTKGFSSLVQLFYDTIRVGSPQIIMSDQAFTEYTNFMKTMAHLFKDTAPSTTKNMAITSGLADIKNKRDKGMCAELNLDEKTLPIDPTRVNINAVSAVVKELYQIQVKHAKKCGDIFKLLFDIAYDEKNNPLTISLSKNVLQGGFEEINRINGLARKVLIDYYSDCEYKYVQGVDLIVEPIRQSRKAAASGAPGPAPALQRSYSAPATAPGAPAASRPATGAPTSPPGPPGAASPGARPAATASRPAGGGSFTAKAERKIAYTRKNHVIRQ